MMMLWTDTTPTGHARISYERRRGFQPPYYTVQHIDCPTHGRTTWAPSGYRGLRRTAAGLVGGDDNTTPHALRDVLAEVVEPKPLSKEVV